MVSTFAGAVVTAGVCAEAVIFSGVVFEAIDVSFAVVTGGVCFPSSVFTGCNFATQYIITTGCNQDDGHHDRYNNRSFRIFITHYIITTLIRVLYSFKCFGL